MEKILSQIYPLTAIDVYIYIYVKVNVMGKLKTRTP